MQVENKHWRGFQFSSLKNTLTNVPPVATEYAWEISWMNVILLLASRKT